MRTKVALTVLILIILPTAILSLTAYRAIRNRELLLESRLKDSAENALRAVFGRISAKIADNMNQVNAAMSECIGRSARYRDIEGTVARLCGSGDLVGQVYLFMNPWGFLYPDPVQAAIESYPSEAIALSAEKKEVLIAALRQEIASAEFPEERLFFTSDEISYCFSPIQGRKDLYTGYEIDSARLRKLISDTITSFSARDFIIVAEGRGLEKKDNLAVGDSFSGVIRRKSSPVLNSGRSPVESYGRKRFIAMGRLPVPLENVILTAVMTDSGENRKTAENQSLLYAWGIILLATGIFTGLWIVVHESVAEVSKARIRSDFVIGVSHDLRTPISSMKMLAESLYLGHIPDQGKQKQFLATIARECERLSQMIERVLFFVRYDQEALVYHMKQIEPGGLVESAVRTFEARYYGTEDRGQRTEDRGQRSEDRGQRAEDRGQPALRSPAAAGRSRDDTRHPALRGKLDIYPALAGLDTSPSTIDHGPLTMGAGAPLPACNAMRSIAGRLQCSITPNLPSIHADESAMTQVILNLLDNAMKYGGGNTMGQKSEVRGQMADDRGQKSEVRSKFVDVIGQADDGGRISAGLKPQHLSAGALAKEELNNPTTSQLPQTPKHPYPHTPIHVSVDTVDRKGRSWVRISVKDHGIGIERKYLKKIFRRYYRVPGSSSANVSGVGLGLALCSHIVKAHGGWIDVESEPGKGSEFEVFLPVG